MTVDSVNGVFNLNVKPFWLSHHQGVVFDGKGPGSVRHIALKDHVRPHLHSVVWKFHTFRRRFTLDGSRVQWCKLILDGFSCTGWPTVDVIKRGDKDMGQDSMIPYQALLSHHTYKPHLDVIVSHDRFEQGDV